MASSYSDVETNRMQYAFEMNNAFKPQDRDAHSSVETRASTKSPNSGVDADEYQLMDELVDAEALACSMPQPQMRLSPDEQGYGSYNMAESGPMSPTNMAPHSPMGYAMEMPSNMPMQMMPGNAPVMYSPTGMSMQQGQQVQMMYQQGAMQGHSGPGQQYVQVPMMMPVRMVPVPVPMNQMQMGAAGPQVPQGYYLVQDAGEQHAQQPAPVAGDSETAPQNFLESLMPTGWRKRQRPSKRPAARMQKVPSGRKIFVGGLSPNSTAESLINHFGEYGKISDASVIHEAVTRRSRGFGYVEFVDKIPDGLLEMDHYIDQRRCGVRGYDYDPAEPAPDAKKD